MLTLEEFAFRCEWEDAMRLSQYLPESAAIREYIKIIREHKKGRPVFKGPYGDKSEWAGTVRNWYKHYLEEAKQ